MRYLILLNKYFIHAVCLCGFFSYPLAAQSANPLSFDLSKYEFTAGTSEPVDISLNVKLPQANRIEIGIPFENVAIAIESVRRIAIDNTFEYWLTNDSTLFSKNLPQTAWVITHKNSLLIRTSPDIKKGEQLVIRIIISVPRKGHTKDAASPSSSPSKSDERRMAVSLLHSSSPGQVSKYLSAKPISIKRQGIEK